MKINFVIGVFLGLTSIEAIQLKQKDSDEDKDDAKDSISESNMAAFGPQEEIQLPEINFTPSGNTPDIDLGAPPYDLNVAERRRQNFLTMKHTIKEKMELYTASTKGKLEELKDALTNPSK